MAKGRGGLGRGLESLFEDAAPSFESDTRIETLPLREIEPDPGQPARPSTTRRWQSFRQHRRARFIATPSRGARLKPSGGATSSWQARRRWRASRMAGLTEVPVIVKDVTDEQAMELALVENLRRKRPRPCGRGGRHP